MTNDVTAYKVAVLAGGWSDERDISFASAKEVKSALEEAGFAQVDLLDIAEDGFADTIAHGGYDVAFVAMHGKFGEDGCVQGMLEILHIPYTFSGVLASSMAMDKGMAKSVYSRANIPVSSDIIVEQDDPMGDEDVARIVDQLGLPLFVKPSSNGSSYGVSKVDDASELAAAVKKARETGGRVLIEAAVEGIEITVPVLGNEHPRALTVIEVVTGADFYDEFVKYEPSELHHVIPARIDPDSYALVQELAVRAHVALGCRGCSRSDFILRADGTPVILETNTIPGMTPASLLPDSARHEGISFPSLCRTFVELAMESHI
jgi:D-alanine-D-alanine ligase